MERPVFFDGTGRRARVVRWCGRLVAAVMPVWLLAVVAGALTPLSLPSLPGSLASTPPATPAHTLTRAPHLTHGPPSVAELSERA
jgi:hypothetical protein